MLALRRRLVGRAASEVQTSALILEGFGPGYGCRTVWERSWAPLRLQMRAEGSGGRPLQTFLPWLGMDV